MIRRPALLSADMTESTRLDPTAMSVTLNMVGASEATISLPDDAPEVRIHDWISIYTGRGFCGVFRVSNIADGLRRQTDLTLLHGRDILADSAWADQLEFEGTKAEYLAALLNQQTHLINGVKPWVLGTCADTSTYKKSINYDRLSNLLEELEEDGSDYYFTYDQTVFPWVLNYVAKDQTVTSEFRLTRNVHAATVTYNDADLCTRLHLSINVKVEDEDTSTHSTDTIIKTYDNQAAQTGPGGWGVVVKTADIDTQDDLSVDPPLTPEADAWAANFLARRAEPSVQIQIDGEELKALTGEDWDEVDIGRLCQVALPAYRRSFQERVVSIVYDFSIDCGQIAPAGVNVSLANALPKFSETIAQIRDEADKAARAARGGGRGAASAEELKVWSKHVWYQGQALDGTGIITLYESGIDMDAAGGVTIFSLEQGVQALYSSIQTNARNITLKVSNGDVATQLAVECGNVYISGTPGSANLIVDGYVEATDIFSASGTLHDIYSETIHTQDADINGDANVGGDLSVDGGLSVALANTVTCGNIACGNVDCDGIAFNGGTVYTGVIVDASVDQQSNTLTLTKSNGQTVNFSKAGGVITAITKSGQTWKPALFTHGGFEVGVYASGINVGTYSDTIEVDAAYAYSAGWTDGYDDCEAEFVQATVTPQGASETVYVPDANGTAYYKKSSTSYNRLGTSHQYTFYGALYKPEGAGPSWVSQGNGTWYLWTGDHRNAYLYQVGSSVTPCDTSSEIKITSDTRYKQGTPDSTTYYTRSSS